MVDVRVAHFARGMSERGQRAALVAGGSAGIGLAIAEEFAAGGHHLLLVARKQERLEAVADRLARQYRVTVGTLALDITRPDAVEQIKQWLTSSGFAVSYLVNSAGTWLDAALRDCDASQLETVLAANITAVHRLTHLVMPGMLQAGSGGILNVGSLAGMAPCPGFALYGASKAFLHDMTLALREELKGTGVTVSLLAPGVVSTGFFGSGAIETITGRWLSALQSKPQTVARAAYRGLISGQAVIVPGLLWRLAWLGARLLPTRVTAPLIGIISYRLLARATPARQPAAPATASLASSAGRASLGA